MNQKNSRKGVLFRIVAWIGLIGLMALLSYFSLPAGKVNAQQPTGSIPTVTGTPSGPIVEVVSWETIIGVYAGPSLDSYPQIGILMAGERVPALGYSTDDQWIQVVYMGVRDGKGWIYAPYVTFTSPGVSLPRIEAPATATPATTPTLDPTYVAAYGLTLEPTQLPTFTAPGALQIPTFASPTTAGSTIPFGLIVLGLVFVGVLGGIVSFLRGSR